MVLGADHYVMSPARILARSKFEQGESKFRTWSTFDSQEDRHALAERSAAIIQLQTLIRPACSSVEVCFSLENAFRREQNICCQDSADECNSHDNHTESEIDSNQSFVIQESS